MRLSLARRFVEYVPKGASATVTAANPYEVTRAFRATAAAAAASDDERDSRGFFYLPRLDYDVGHGVAPLLSRKQFQVQYDIFHRAAVERLNAHTIGTDLEGHNLNVVIRSSSFDASRAVVHAAASEHFNYCFWYRSLRPWGTAVPARLKEELQLQYSDRGTLDAVEEVRRRFLMAALSQQSAGGWVYLVWTGKLFDILAFDHGTCPIGSDLIPLLGLNVHESAMYFDYHPTSSSTSASTDGTEEAMERYVNNFFKTCNWGMAERYFLQSGRA